MKKLLIMLLIIFNVSILNAEISLYDESRISYPEQTSEDYSRRFIRISYTIPRVDLLICRYDDNLDEYNGIQYSPNSEALLSYEINLNGVNLYVSNPVSIIGISDYSYKVSEFTDIKLSYFTDSFGAETSWQRYKGFHLINPEEHGIIFEPERNELEISKIYGGFFYKLFEYNNYSVAASFDQSEIQKDRISASFMLMLSADRIKIDSDYSLIPEYDQPEYGRYSVFRESTIVSFAASPGIGITFSLSNFYISTAFFIGIGYQHLKINTVSGYLSDNTDFLKEHYFLSAGYNGTNLLCGCTITFDGTQCDYPDADTSPDSSLHLDLVGSRIEFFTGIRF